MLTLTGSMINGVQTTMYALAAHVYPSAVRSTGVGTAVAFGRSGAVMTGYVGSWAIGLGGTRVVAAEDAQTPGAQKIEGVGRIADREQPFASRQGEPAGAAVPRVLEGA